jgi:hypothetical protein
MVASLPRARAATTLRTGCTSQVEFLESRADMVAARVGNDELEVSLLGSYGIEEA